MVPWSLAEYRAVVAHTANSTFKAAMEILKDQPSIVWWGIGCIGAVATFSFAKVVLLFIDVVRKPVGQPSYARMRNTPSGRPVPPRVVIIGAGPAGIATAGALNHLGIDNVVIERSGEIASSWRGHYKRLHLHTPNHFSHLPHVPFPPHYPLYISRQQVVDYITGYASMMQVKVNFHESVTSVARDGTGGKWVVETKRKDDSTVVYTPDVVVVCTGENTVPFIPTFTDQNKFKGTILHSSKYHSAEEYRGKKALIVGFGNTGGELAVDLYEHGCDVSVVIRSPVNIVKRHALVLVPALVRHFPTWLQLGLEWIVVRLDYGDMHKYGIQCPISSGVKDLGYYRLRNFHEAPVVDLGQIDLIRKKLVKVHTTEIERFTPTGVVFKNGAEENFDVVVLATGFKPNLSQILSPDVYADATNALGFPHKKDKQSPGLYFLGFEDEAGRFLKIKEDAIVIANLVKERVL